LEMLDLDGNREVAKDEFIRSFDTERSDEGMSRDGRRWQQQAKQIWDLENKLVQELQDLKEQLKGPDEGIRVVQDLKEQLIGPAQPTFSTQRLLPPLPSVQKSERTE
jgi:hypothetical protein